MNCDIVWFELCTLVSEVVPASYQQGKDLSFIVIS